MVANSGGSVNKEEPMWTTPDNHFELLVNPDSPCILIGREGDVSSILARLNKEQAAALGDLLLRFVREG
jgi:hypothetical protein